MARMPLPRSRHVARKKLPARDDSSRKLPFDIAKMMRLVRGAVRDYPKAVLFELAERGFSSPFEILIACILTIRTLEEVSLPAALKLFGTARTPEEMARLKVEQIDALIATCTFHRPKAKSIYAIARKILDEFHGNLPCDFDALTSLAGVGPKCANLALGIGCGEARGIPVDIHVHRVTNRWGYVNASMPEKTMAQLQKKLPRRYWLEINKLMVPFGKHICTGKLPHCSTCPVLDYCRQVGVTEHR